MRTHTRFDSLFYGPPGAKIPKGVAASLVLEGPVVRAKICFDGRCYEGAMDLSLVLGEIAHAIADYHQRLHATAATVQAAGDILVGALIEENCPGQTPPVIGGWFDDFTRAAEDVGTGGLAEAFRGHGHGRPHAHRPHGHGHAGHKASGWFGDLERSVKKGFKDVEKDVSHYVLHPSDIMRDAGKAIGLPKSVSNALSYAVDPLQVVTENPLVQKAAASYFGGAAGAAALNAAQQAEQGKLSLQGALSAASPILQQYGAPAAVTDALSQAQGYIKQAEALPQQAQQFLQQLPQQATQYAQQAAQPYVQQAQQAVQQATQDLSQQAQGFAQQATQGLSQDASSLTGDLSAAANALGTNVLGGGDQSPTSVTSSGVPEVRQTARAHAEQKRDRVVGVVLRTDGVWDCHAFADSDAADDWFGRWLGHPEAFQYVAYFDKGDMTYPGPLNEQISTHVVASAAVQGWFLPFLGGAGLGAAGMHYYDHRHPALIPSPVAPLQAAPASPGAAPKVAGFFPFLVGGLSGFAAGRWGGDALAWARNKWGHH